MTTRGPAFNQWFDGSQVTDTAGRPLLVFHGTVYEFDEFAFQDVSRDSAVFFSSSLEVAMRYTTSAIEEELSEEGLYHPTIKVAALRILNPLVVDAGSVGVFDGVTLEDALDRESYMSKLICRAKHEGHDGVIIRDSRDGCLPHMEYVAFSMDQIHVVRSILPQQESGFEADAPGGPVL